MFAVVTQVDVVRGSVDSVVCLLEVVRESGRREKRTVESAVVVGTAFFQEYASKHLAPTMYATAVGNSKAVKGGEGEVVG